MLKNNSFISWGAMLSLLFFSVAAEVSADGRKDHDDRDKRAEITQVTADMVGMELHITGNKLMKRKNPIVLLGKTELVVISADETRIDAYLPPGITAGDYLLEVFTKKGHEKSDKSIAYDLTIGAVGPQGEQGDQGIQGIQGEVGLTGSQGETGPQGPKGDIGITGSQGETGSQGVKGDTGIAGPVGLRGPIGFTGSQGSKGDTGDTGPQGLKGDTGASGPQGAQGAVGFTPYDPADLKVRATSGTYVIGSDSHYYHMYTTTPDTGPQYSPTRFPHYSINYLATYTKWRGYNTAVPKQWRVTFNAGQKFKFPPSCTCASGGVDGACDVVNAAVDSLIMNHIDTTVGANNYFTYSCTGLTD